MVKNFFEYVKELIPEKGEVFFTHENHSTSNAVSLYQLADLLCGKKIDFASDVTAYSWRVQRMWRYPFATVGIMFLREDREKWIHFSKNAFIGAICIVATRNDVTFDDEEHENLRQIWARKINGEETEEDKEVTDLEERESNFDDKLFVSKLRKIEEEERAFRRADPLDVLCNKEERRKLGKNGRWYVYDFNFSEYVLEDETEEERALRREMDRRHEDSIFYKTQFSEDN